MAFKKNGEKLNQTKSYVAMENWKRKPLRENCIWNQYTLATEVHFMFFFFFPFAKYLLPLNDFTMI